MFDIGLPGVDGLSGLAAHVVDVGAELRGPAQIDRRAHRQLLQPSPLLRQANGLRIFLSGQHKRPVFSLSHALSNINITIFSQYNAARRP